MSSRKIASPPSRRTGGSQKAKTPKMKAPAINDLDDEKVDSSYSTISSINDRDTYVLQDSDNKSVFNNYTSLVKKSGLESELIRQGYTIIDKIVIDGMAKYIRAYNPHGIKVFIEMNTDGYVNAASNISVIEQTETNSVPSSIRIGAFKSANNELTGVAIQSGDKVFILKRDDNNHLVEDGLKINETTYVLKNMSTMSGVSGVSGKSLVDKIPVDKTSVDKMSEVYDEKSTHIYPLLRMSDVRGNPGEVIRFTSKVYERLKHNTYRMCMVKLQEYENSLRDLQDVFETFGRKIKPVNETLTKSMEDNVKRINSSPVIHGKINSPAKRELIRLNHLNENLHGYCDTISVAKEKLDEMTMLLKNVNEQLKQEFGI